MALCNLSELRLFLAKLGVRPLKSLSQNFLIDGNIVSKIVQEADVQPEDLILEIGAGPGALTEALLATGAEVIAVEKDRTFAEALSRFKDLKVYAGDVLEFPLEWVTRKAKVVSNLPYHLTTPILARLIPHFDLFSTMTVMVQEEVARRMTAKSGTENYGSLSVFLHFYSTLRYAFMVSRNCFYPKPNVDSAVVTLRLKPPPLIEEKGFFDLVHRAFQQRRKMLKTSLADFYDSKLIAEALVKCGSSVTARPEELSLETFLSIYNQLSESSAIRERSL